VGTAWSIPCISSFFLLVVAETHGFCAAPIALCPHWKRRQKTLWTEHRERGDGRFKILDLFAYECCTPAVPPGRLVGRLRSRLRKTTQRGIRVGTPGAEWKGRAVGGRLLIGLFFLSFHCTFFAVLYLKKKRAGSFLMPRVPWRRAEQRDTNRRVSNLATRAVWMAFCYI